VKWLRLSVLFSPVGFLALAALIAAAYHACDALDWREYTCILSGSVPLGAAQATAMFRGGAYIILYFAYVLIAPILTLAAGLLVVVRRRIV
jgi:hypothetical protein